MAAWIRIHPNHVALQRTLIKQMTDIRSKLRGLALNKKTPRISFQMSRSYF